MAPEPGCGGKFVSNTDLAPRRGACRFPWRALVAALAVAAGVALSACSHAPEPYRQEAYVFGTRVEVLVADQPEAQARPAVAAVLQEFDRLHRTYHAWQPSELTRVNQAFQNGQAIRVSPEMRGLVADAQAIARKGDWLFDPGVGRLVQLWGFHSDEFRPRLPDMARVSFLTAAHPSLQGVQIRGDKLYSPNPAVALDFGGYLKGVALDRAAAMLKARGIHHALINIGGNVLALGDKHGEPWRVGIQHPRKPGPMATLELRDGEAIGTSGDYQRFFEVGGKRYCHLLDPRTGHPAEGTEAVTVLIPPGPHAGALSDAASKPLFIGGPSQWLRLARQLGVSQALRVDASGKVQVTPALDDRIKFESGVDTEVVGP